LAGVGVVGAGLVGPPFAIGWIGESTTLAGDILLRPVFFEQAGHAFQP
jgi:hypothetical protein